jgi:4-carboxymuconolactone decarboxylase
MTRVPYISRDELDAEGQSIYDQIAADRGRTDVGLQFRALLNNPRAAGYLTSLGATLRFQSSIPEGLKELAISTTGREWDSHIIWTSHSALAAKEGISAASLESVRTKKDPESLTGDEAIITRFVHEMIQDKQVSDETFSAAQELLGVQGVVDLTLTISYYSALALAQIALKLEMDPGRTSTL